MNKAPEIIETELLPMEYDFVEYFVGMAKMVVYWHVKALGFHVVAYCGPETGVPDRCSYFIRKNNIKLVITSASQPSSYKIVSFVDLHGNGIKRLAVRVENVAAAFEKAIADGAMPLQRPESISDQRGTVHQASLKIFDDNEIVFVNYDNYNGDFMPGYVNVEKDWDTGGEDSALEKIDHVACALRLNEMRLWEGYFNNIFQSRTVGHFDERRNAGEKKAGMLLKVLQSGNKGINNVLVEPDPAVKSQVQLFVDQHYGAGIQHIAFASSNIFHTVSVLRAGGLRFTRNPDSYYRQLAIDHPQLDVATLQKHGVLCEVFGETLLLQIFTTPIGDRPTFFYEIVQRVNNYDGFGVNNIRALFAAVEAELAGSI